MRLGILASGELGFLCLQRLLKQYEVVFVMTDKGSEKVRSLCSELNIPLFVGNPRNGKSKSFVSDKRIEVLISINYLFLIEEDLISLPDKVAFNIHGSLLPKYRGRTPHVWAIINNEEKAGITAHVIDRTCDTGPILSQVCVPIDTDDTGFTVLQKYNALYPTIIEDVLRRIGAGVLAYIPQDEGEATYFGKRTPEDGRINWNWHKERIRNWIRAQSYPYPGAYTYLRGKKIIIDKISYSNCGYHYEMANGTVVSTEPLQVKTPNGVVTIDTMRSNDTLLFNINDILE